MLRWKNPSNDDWDDSKPFWFIMDCKKTEWPYSKPLLFEGQSKTTTTIQQRAKARL